MLTLEALQVLKENEGAIGLDRPHDCIGRAICGVTGEEVSHVKQYLLGCTFERTVWWEGVLWRSGIRVTEGFRDADFYGLPREPFTEEQLRLVLRYWLSELNARTPYNVPKLLGMYLVVKVGWRRPPFSARSLGDVCSPTVDKALKAGGLDALPGRGEQGTTPGAFLDSPLYRFA